MMNVTTVNALHTGQELTATGAPKLAVTVNITEPVEKRLSLAVERRIWSLGDTGGGAWARAKLAGATDHGARGQLWNEACTHGSLTLPRNTRYKHGTALLRCQTLNGSQPRKLCPNAVL